MDDLLVAVSNCCLKDAVSVLDSINNITLEVQDSCIDAAKLAIEQGSEELVDVIMTCKVFRRSHKQKLLLEIPNLLYHACWKLGKSRRKLESMISTLLRSNTGINSDAMKYLNEGGFSALHMAAMDGNVQAAKQLLRLGADGKQQSRDGNTALTLSIACKHQTFWEFILPFSNVNSKDEDHDTALMFAAWRRKHDLLSELLLSGADANARSRHGSTALWNAVYRGSQNCVILLLQNNADMSVCCEGTHLFLTSEDNENDSEVVKIYKGSNRSLLWVATDFVGNEDTRSCYLPIISILLEAGYDVTKDHWIKCVVDLKTLRGVYGQTLLCQNTDKRQRFEEENDLPGRFMKDYALQCLLSFYYTRPRQLKALCRKRIQNIHRADETQMLYHDWVSELGLDDHLTDYLSFGYLKLT